MSFVRALLSRLVYLGMIGSVIDDNAAGAWCMTF